MPIYILIEAYWEHCVREYYREFCTSILNELGYKVIRFKNEEVTNSISTVLEKIKAELNNRKDLLHPQLFQFRNKYIQLNYCQSKSFKQSKNKN